MCKESNNAPFAVGQKVIALFTRTNEVGVTLIKGKKYTVVNLMQCPQCGHWSVDIGLRAKRTGFSICKNHHDIDPDSIICWTGCELLAPIQHQYTDISREIADSMKETAETPDIIKQPVLS